MDQISQNPLLAQFSSEPVPCSVEWRGKHLTFHLREVSAEEAERLLDILGPDGKVDSHKARGLSLRIVAACVVNADGTPAFTVAEAGKLPATVAKQLEQDASALNGFRTDDGDDAGNG